ncbi:hypothetical protein BDV95DRAFT_586216 [Massariosphaeria phaeospora]|uniref:Uncharacterized protein n=1 Tax=Massariosphaeria phaeospora TaxID=100035 RepID=A0A7C8M2I7_9PLEO|nr:hypothetical protein BDV95DRAFT_586216 [Massariosphaeria phaeospora]
MPDMRSKDIVVLSVVLGFCFLAAMTRFLWANRTRDSPATRYEPSIASSGLKVRRRSWSQLFKAKHEKQQTVPTLSGIIKAGDEGVYSSTLFDAMYEIRGDIPLSRLHEEFASAVRHHSVMHKSEISQPASTKHRVGRSQSVRTTKKERSELPSRQQRNSLDLAERGLVRSKSKKTAPVLISARDSLSRGRPESQHAQWVADHQQAQDFGGRTGIMVTPAELTALSTMLGSTFTYFQPPKNSEKPGTSFASDKGAFGLTISGSATEDGRFHVFLTQHKRSVAHLPPLGSGYSTLFAKHLASGALPFSQDIDGIKTILITDKTFEAIQTGTPLHLQKSTASTPGAAFLATLPSARTLSFHTLVPSLESNSLPTLLQSIASLPFTGGLVPLASSPLIQTVRFATSAGLPPGRLLQRLDALVEKVHRHTPHLRLFGPLLDNNNAGILFRERERLGKLATGATTDDSIGDKVARMHRYITLLERLMCLVPDVEPRDVLAQVQEATLCEVQRSYHDALTLARLALQPPCLDYYTSPPTTTTTAAALTPHTPPPKRHSRSSLPRMHHRTSTSSSSAWQTATPSPASLPSARASSSFPALNLGAQVEPILKARLPFGVDVVAVVVRLVVAAWTESVGKVAWEGDEVGGIRLRAVGMVEGVGAVESGMVLV